MSDAKRAAELAARVSYGKLLAILSAKTGDITSAEDALADAFAKALDVWSEKGVPDNPDAWLVKVAGNKIKDLQRRNTRFQHTDEIPETTPDMSPNMLDEMESIDHLTDKRLELLFVCAHPSIARDLHTPLMMQSILGINANDIARIFMVQPAAMAQRLVRAKRKIKLANIPFELPDGDLPRERLSAVLEAIYAAYAVDWLFSTDEAQSEEDANKEDLKEEALYLSNLLIELLPGEAEVLGLAAYLALDHSRSDARVQSGVLVPTEEQDVSLWDDDLIAYGEQKLQMAQKLMQPDRFQIEAAIQCVHLRRKRTGETDWDGLNKLYFALLKFAPSAGAMIAHIIVNSHIHGPEEGSRQLGQLSLDDSFQPFWAAKADLSSKAGCLDSAKEAYEKAIALSTDLPSRRFLEAKLSALSAKMH